MKVSTTTLKHLAAGELLGTLASPLHAWEPNAKELDAAINSGDIAGYLTSATTWLNQKVPAKPDESALSTLLRDPAFRAVIDQRQLIAKTGADQLAAYAKAAPANAAFLGPEGTPAPECFLDDMQHPSTIGNARRAELLRPMLKDLLEAP